MDSTEFNRIHKMMRMTARSYLLLFSATKLEHYLDSATNVFKKTRELEAEFKTTTGKEPIDVLFRGNKEELEDYTIMWKKGA